ncbi:MAG: peptide deformylase [Patescibacteria group bacterium]|nr:peptide deformylase [Patescibacteria group bacterium]
MAIRKIVTIDDKNDVLTTRAAEIDPKELGSADFVTLIDDMVETMRVEDGVGLAAPQIGVGKRVYVADTEDGPIALVNPEFTKRSKKTGKYEEGCLSIPGKFGIVRRASEVTVKALTIDGREVTFVAKGFFARVMQHEMDHLDGILYIDRIKEQQG